MGSLILGAWVSETPPLTPPPSYTQCLMDALEPAVLEYLHVPLLDEGG